jgi:hypothetical protein
MLRDYAARGGRSQHCDPDPSADASERTLTPSITGAGESQNGSPLHTRSRDADGREPLTRRARSIW